MTKVINVIKFPAKSVTTMSNAERQSDIITVIHKGTVFFFLNVLDETERAFYLSNFPIFAFFYDKMILMMKVKLIEEPVDWTLLIHIFSE